MKKYWIIFFVAWLCQPATAQVTGEVNVLDRDVFYLQYTPPNLISDDYNYQRWSAKFSIPPIRLGKLSLFSTFGLDIHHFNYDQDEVGENADIFDKFYNLNYSLVAQYKLSEKWSINAMSSPFAIGNYEDNLSIDGDDLHFNGMLFAERTFYRKRGGYFQFGFGVGYLTLNGTTRINPITQLKARLNEKWSFVLGLPNTYVKWDFHPKHSIKVLADLNDFSANISEMDSVQNFTDADRAVFTVAAVGLEYNYWLRPSLGLLFKVTHSGWSNYEIRDSDNEAIYEFDTNFKQPFVSVGIKFNPIRQLQNSLNPF